MSTKQDYGSLLKLSRYFFPVMEAEWQSSKRKTSGAPQIKPSFVFLIILR